MKGSSLWNMFPMAPSENTWIVRVSLVFLSQITLLEVYMIGRKHAGIHGKILDFASRLDIAIDVAHAVTYLHMYTGWKPLYQMLRHIIYWSNVYHLPFQIIPSFIEI